MIIHCAVFILKLNQNTLLISDLFLDKKYSNSSTNFIELIIYICSRNIFNPKQDYNENESKERLFKGKAKKETSIDYQNQ